MPIVLASLGLILYFIIYLAAFVPSGDFEYYWLPDNVMVVQSVYENSPAAQYIQPDDVILEIDGRPAVWSLWQPLFTVGKQTSEYTIQRREQVFTYEFEAASPNYLVIGKRAASGFVALFGWLVGSLAILFATPENRDAWQLGVTATLASVAIAASEAGLYNVPGGWLSNPLLPVVAVAWIQVALLPRDGIPSRHERYVFRLLYAGAIIIALTTLLELFFLTPNRSSIHLITGISSYDVLLLCLVLGLLVHLIILGWRFVHLPSSYQRQQMLIVLVFAALAYLPPLLLTLLPGLLFDVLLLPWELAILLLVLSPAGYAYVIYRRKYLGLDIFITRTLTLLIVSLLLLSGYSLVFYFVQQQFAENVSRMVPGTLLIFSLVLGGPYANRKIRQAFDMVVYGSAAHYQERIAHFTSRLSADPQITTLKEILYEVGTQLQIRQQVLMLTDHDGLLVTSDQLRVRDPILPFSVQEFEHTIVEGNPQFMHVKGSEHPVFSRHPWIHYVVPLSTGGRIVGAMFLGQPVPEGYLNAREAEFLCQVANVTAVALEAIQLFESSREMSRTLLEIRDSERMLLASQIHDEPLQRISMLAGELLHLANQGGSDSGIADKLESYGQSLQQVNRQLRDICAGLYPPVLRQGPQWAVRDIVYDFREKTDLDVRLSITLSEELLVSEDVTRVVYHLLTESLNNVHKHAEATTVWISLRCQDDKLVLSVEDDGKATSPAILSLSDLVRARHFGVAGMHELADLIHGDLAIEKRAGSGTIVILSAPLRRDKQGAPMTNEILSR